VEKAKAFFLICAGILMLTMAGQQLVQPASADSDDLRDTLVALQFDEGNHHLYVLSASGEIWKWYDEWHYIATWPGGGVPIENTNWSQLKSNYGK